MATDENNKGEARPVTSAAEEVAASLPEGLRRMLDNIVDAGNLTQEQMRDMINDGQMAGKLAFASRSDANSNFREELSGGNPIVPMGKKGGNEPQLG